MMPAMPETTLQDAMALHRGGRVEEAITAYRAVIAAGHDLLPAGVNLGRLLTQLQLFPPAARELDSSPDSGRRESLRVVVG